MITFNSPYISPESNKGILINGHLTVQAAADTTGYNIQYLRRLLRSGKLDRIKFSQIWLIDMGSLETYLKDSKTQLTDGSGRACGFAGSALSTWSCKSPGSRTSSHQT